jgi:hypothetical protein
LNLRVSFDHCDLVVEGNWAVTLNVDLLGVRSTKFTSPSHVDGLGELVSKFAVDHREGVNGHQNFIAFTVDTNRIVVVSVGHVTGRSELNVNVLSDTRGQHSLLVETNFEVGGLRGQHVQALRSRRVVDYTQFQRVRLVGFKASKLHDTRRCLKNSVTTDSVESILSSNGVHFGALDFLKHLAL